MIAARVSRTLCLLSLIALTLTACGAATPAPTTAPPPTATVVPTLTEKPTAAAEPAATAAPATVAPTATPVPAPTATDAPAPLIPAADEATTRITVPVGFHITVFAEGLPGARFLAFGPDGALYVSLMGTGRIARLPDADEDGRADAVEIAAEGLSTPHGLEWHEGWLYVAELDRLERLRDEDGDGVLEQRELVTDNLPGGGGHRSRTVHFGPDGMIYVAAGSSCNICVEEDPRRAAILRFAPDGSIPADNPFADDPDPRRQAVWAEGLRNSVDFLFLPDGRLWANENGSDGLGDDVPPEAAVIEIEPGRHYGWPYCYTPVVGANLPPDQQAEVRDDRMDLPAGFDCSQAVPALFTDPAHSAPLGMTLVESGNFPAEYQGDLLEGYHGSWNTTAASIRDCKVRRIVVEEGLPVSAEDFATGWRAEGQPCGSAGSYGRPVDVVFAPDGALYISDDLGNRVYRVVYMGE